MVGVGVVGDDAEMEVGKDHDAGREMLVPESCVYRR